MSNGMVIEMVQKASETTCQKVIGLYLKYFKNVVLFLTYFNPFQGDTYYEARICAC